MQNRPTILISWKTKTENYQKWVRRMGFNYSYDEGDLLLVIGGIDIGLNPDRDEYEYNLINKFKSEDKPIFGICRGMQMLGKMEGLTLYEHLPDIPSLQEHRPEDNIIGPSNWHIVKDNYLPEKIFSNNPNDFIVNSRHHQGFILEEGQIEWLTSKDNVIEGIKRDWFTAVQYHPERPEMKESHAEKIATNEIKYLINKTYERI